MIQTLKLLSSLTKGTKPQVRQLFCFFLAVYHTLSTRMNEFTSLECEFMSLSCLDQWPSVRMTGHIHQVGPLLEDRYVKEVAGLDV